MGTEMGTETDADEALAEEDEGAAAVEAAAEAAEATG